MFGMLDYRAHKLYLILFGIPNFLIMWLWIIAVPIISYLIAFDYFDIWIYRVSGAIVVLLLAELIAGLLSYVIDWLFFSTFTLIVDIIPHDGRSKNEAKEVVKAGGKAVVLYETKKNPADWTDEQIEELVRLDWAARLFYGERVRARCNFLREYYQSHPDDDPFDEFGDATPHWVIKNAGLNQGIVEATISNRVSRIMTIRYAFFLWLIAFNPSGY